MNKVIFIIGPPGSGKGTQAELLAKKLGLFHLETSKIIEAKFADPNLNDEMLKHEYNNWKNGKLVDQNLIQKWIVEEINRIHATGQGFVTSGSPRTVLEFEGELPWVRKLYGKENIKIIHIKLSKEESIKRNSKRRICVKNRHPIPNFPEYENINKCPYCGSELTTRELDTPETIAVRYQVYIDQTEPIFKYIKSQNIPHIDVNGEQSIERVNEEITDKLNSQ